MHDKISQAEIKDKQQTVQKFLQIICKELTLNIKSSWNSITEKPKCNRKGIEKG